MYRRILIASGVLALAIPTNAFAAPDDPLKRFDKAPSAGVIDSDVLARSLAPDAKVQVIVEVKGDPVAVVEADKGRKLTNTERKAVRDKLRKTQDKVAKTITGRGGKVKSNMQSAYNGMRVQIASSQLETVAALPEVVAIHAAQIFRLNNEVSVPYLGVPQVWQSTGYTGKAIKVAVIDTGIDFTHANFGGPGTVAAYEAAKAAGTSPADPALFGPSAPRIKGGYDFVGDDYDADSDDPALNTPKPDPNPLDCNGHGSHVAGTVGGNGVLPDGQTYKGPYNAATSSVDFRIGPGVAPEVGLYALRVFGCEGSTDVTTEAIDWAVANDMDVINMSLGSSFGRADDPSAVAASNAVGAGVVVVASAGNSGGNPYITGSPGTGEGVIAVSAVDSSETFAGAALTFSNGTTLDAIRSNNAPLSEVPLDVVILADDPATTDEDEALGCSEAAFTKAGVTDSKNQLAVATRGTCARVAKAIFGQKAGAKAVLQINTDPGYPPYEGDITSNPDTGEQYVVTIPFLGVRSTDRPAVVAANGGTVTMVGKPLANPSFSGYASFSSSGPRNGDSSISPNVAAPGVSIISTGVGTGAGGATISGTSMAAPHVAGVAALAVQSHPRWGADEIAAAIVTTSDPEKVTGQRLVRGGLGLVDTAQAVATQTVVAGDPYRTTNGWFREPSLSFGFAEPSKGFVKKKTLTIENKGKKTVTYKLSSTLNPESKRGSIKLSKKSVTVKPGKTAKVFVTLVADASKLGSSVTTATDPFAFNEVSGNVVLTSVSEVLRVPYLLVPRAQAKVTDLNKGKFDLTSWVVPGQGNAQPTASSDDAAELSAADEVGEELADDETDQNVTDEEAAEPEAEQSATPASGAPTPSAGSGQTGTGVASASPDHGKKGWWPWPWKPAPKPPKPPKPKPEPVPATSATIKLVNIGGAIKADADFYTWGLKDGKDVHKRTPGSGFDLRAAGVQSFPISETDALLVFAVNNHTRWSNAVLNEFDVEIDTTGDGKPDWIVFSFDSGYVRAGSFNGLTEVFLQEVATEQLYASGFLATAPTDSSTILLPVRASFLDLSPTTGGFSYTVSSYSLEGTGTDTITASAKYNPWAKAIEDGQFATVPPAKRKKTAVVTVTAAIDPAQWAQQKPLGLMAVVLDNKSGAAEAVLVAGK